MRQDRRSRWLPDVLPTPLWLRRLGNAGPAVAAADHAGPWEIPERCEATLAPVGGYPPGRLRDWLLLDDKCMAPAEAIIAWRCDRGHSGMTAKRELHSRNDGTQSCGPCASAGERFPVTVSLVGKL